MSGSVSDTVPLVWMLSPLHGGYTMTVCAAASDQVAAAKTSWVRENMLAGRCQSGGQERCESPCLVQDSVPVEEMHSLRVVDASRQHAVAGASSTYGPQDKAVAASCNHPDACKCSRKDVQANEDCQTGPPGGQPEPVSSRKLGVGSEWAGGWHIGWAGPVTIQLRVCSTSRAGGNAPRSPERIVSATTRLMRALICRHV